MVQPVLVGYLCFIFIVAGCPILVGMSRFLRLTGASAYIAHSSKAPITIST